MIRANLNMVTDEVLSESSELHHLPRRRERFSDDAERLLDRWIRFALAPLPGGAYRVRALARRASIFFEADAYVTRWT